MSDKPLNEQELAALREIDTPTVCNALEILCPERRAVGFTTETLHCAFPDLPPIVGYAKTATIRAMEQNAGGKEKAVADRIAYYKYVESDPRPSVMVIQDVDSRPGFGAWWGEVHSNVHKALGCLGVVTNGSVRDLDVIADGFQLLSAAVGPSHAWVHLVDIDCEVDVCGMVTRTGDLVHADRHGAAIIPHAVARDLPQAADLCMRREAPILEACGRADFSADVIADAMKAADDIH